MSIYAALAATAALGLVVGRLSAHAQLRGLRSEITDLRRAVVTLEGLLRVAEYAAGHDPLTGLPNRSLAARLFTVRQLLGHPTTVALVDLDGFKNINDAFGHRVGDDVLRAVAERLARWAKANQGIAARLAGDEFLLLLPADGTAHAELVNHALAVLSQPVALRTLDGEITVHPRASAGSALHDGANGAFQTVLHQADIALYHAKQRRGTHRLYGADMRMPRNAGRHGPRRRDEHPADDGRDSGGEVTP